LVLVDLDSGWAWCVDHTNLLVLRDLLNGGVGVLDDWGVLDNHWLLDDYLLSWLGSEVDWLLLETADLLFLLLAGDLLDFHLFLLEASDEEEVASNQGERNDLHDDAAAFMGLLMVLAMFLSVVTMILSVVTMSLVLSS
jgi:hypothetical protein